MVSEHHPHSVIIVEDKTHTRERLANAVRRNPLLRLVGEAGTVSAGRSCLQTYKPDFMLTDLDLPDGSGIDLIKVAAKSGRTESIVITVLGDEKHVVAAIQAGAGGYLLKDCDAVGVSDAILQAVNGGAPISPAIARYLLRSLRGNGVVGKTQSATPEYAHQPQESLSQPDRIVTKREQEVLRLIAKGFSYQEIAATLGVSVHTVNSHIKHIYRKLAVGSRGEAVFEATQIGLL